MRGRSFFGCTGYTNFHPEAVSTAEATKRALSLCAADRLRVALIDQNVKPLQELFNQDWYHKLLPGANLATRKEMFSLLVIRNKANHEKINLAVKQVRITMDALEPYARLFECPDVIREAQVAERDAKAYVAASSLFSVTIVSAHKLMVGPAAKYSLENLKECARANKEIAIKNENILSNEILDEFWAIIPDERPLSS